MWKKLTLIIFQGKHEYFQIMCQLGTTYLEYPSSELRGLAHVAVRLDRIEWAGSTWLVRNDNPWVVPCIVGLGSFIHGYSFFGSSPLFSFSISSCKTARIMTALQQKVECKFIWYENIIWRLSMNALAADLVWLESRFDSTLKIQCLIYRFRSFSLLETMTLPPVCELIISSASINKWQENYHHGSTFIGEAHLL